MNDLAEFAEFLLARIAEDKEVARGLQRRAQEHELDCRDPQVLGTVVPGWFDWPRVQEMCTHVLAKCEANRLIVERALFIDGHGPAVAHVRALDMSTGAAAALRDVLRFLGLPYANHPDCREEWKP